MTGPAARQAGPVETGADPSYRPTGAPAEVERWLRWHERAYAEEQADGAAARTYDYLGATIVVPPQVMPITPQSHLLGEQVLAEAGPGQRVLDLGTGSGVNAVLAARRGAEVLAVDINPHALEAARHNAERNGVAARVEVRHSDVFSAVDGRFDLIVFDPPFRWLRPRDWLEAAMTDEGYRALTTFFAEAGGRLTEPGRLLVFFGTSADLGYLRQLADHHGFRSVVVASEDYERDGERVEYFTFKMVPGGAFSVRSPGP